MQNALLQISKHMFVYLHVFIRFKIVQ